jgi:hypothetical protein
VAVAHKQKKKLILHLDNSPIHTAKVAKAKLSQMPVHFAPHPPYSPDLAPSDFFLFGYLKEKIFGLEFESPEALLAWINAEFERIPTETLEEVFECWITRVQKPIEYQGDYFPEDETTLEPICSTKASGALYYPYSWTPCILRTSEIEDHLTYSMNKFTETRFRSSSERLIIYSAETPYV